MVTALLVFRSLKLRKEGGSIDIRGNIRVGQETGGVFYVTNIVARASPTVPYATDKALSIQDPFPRKRVCVCACVWCQGGDKQALDQESQWQSTTGHTSIQSV